MKTTAIELFAGVGGFRVGLNKVRLIDGKTKEKKRFDFVYANQWEPGRKKQYAFDCYQKRFGFNTERLDNIDIAKVDKSLLPDFNLLTAGFPCQDYSVARKTHSKTGIEGKKGVLWWQLKELLSLKHPA